MKGGDALGIGGIDDDSVCADKIDMFVDYFP